MRSLMSSRLIILREQLSLVCVRDVRESLRQKPRPPKLLTAKGLVLLLELPRPRTPDQTRSQSKQDKLIVCLPGLQKLQQSEQCLCYQHVV